MTNVTAENARNSFSEIVSHAAFRKERFVITRNGKRLAAIIPVEELDFLEKVLDDLEDQLDAEDIQAAMEEVRQGKTIPWEQVKKDLNL
jgi:prevent-host-death family protein